VRVLLALSLLSLAGCTAPSSDVPDAPHDETPCGEQPLHPLTLFLAAGYNLTFDSEGPEGSAPANQGHEAFTAELQPWLSSPLAQGIRLEGNVTFDLLVEASGANLYGPGTELYVQLGSDRAYAAEFTSAPPTPVGDASYRVNVTAPLPPGGFTLEAGDRFALLVTSLREGADSAGHQVRFGGEDGSRIRLDARCAPAQEWAILQHLQFPVVLPGNQGLFTGAAPPTEGVNRHTEPFDLLPDTERLTVQLIQAGGAGPKNDMDLYLLDAAGAVVARSTSPGADETILLWPENLDASVPAGPYQVRVESYSGANYTGRIHVVMERGTEAHDD
jgi:hypothetical protein